MNVGYSSQAVKDEVGSLRELEPIPFVTSVWVDHTVDPSTGKLSHNFFFRGLDEMTLGVYVGEEQTVVVEACDQCPMGTYWLERSEFEREPEHGKERELACAGCGRAYLDWLFARNDRSIYFPRLDCSDHDDFMEKAGEWGKTSFAMDPLNSMVFAAELWNFFAILGEIATDARRRAHYWAAAIDAARRAV